MYLLLNPPPNSLSFLVKEQANKTMEAGYDIDIISSHELNDKQIKMLVQLNDYYDNWAFAQYNEISFVEMQHKLMNALYYIKYTLENGKGLIDLCKKNPKLTLKCPGVSNEDDDDDASTSTRGVMTLYKMIYDLTINHEDQFSEVEFRTNMGGSDTIIILNTQKIENIIDELSTYQDFDDLFRIDRLDNEYLYEAIRVPPTSDTQTDNPYFVYPARRNHET